MLLLSDESRSISASSAQTDKRRHDTTINDSTGFGLQFHCADDLCLIFPGDCQLMDFIFCFLFCTNENRSTTSGSELVVGQQIGRSHVHWHVGECRPECLGDSATSAPPPARHFTVPGVQLLWRPQQHADLHAVPDHRPLRTTTSASQPTTTTAAAAEHDRLQRSTRSQS